MNQLQVTLELATAGRGCLPISKQVAEVVEQSGVREGVCVVYCPHTSCSLLVQENADPDVRSDLLGWLERLAPDGDPRHRHVAEGPDDMAAHLRSAITRTSESIPVTGGRLALGTWQTIYLLEHRLQPHRRRVLVHVMGV